MLFTPTLRVHGAVEIDAIILEQHDIKGLILDLDNTLSLHGHPLEKEGVYEWLTQMRELGIPMMVVSNNTRKRVKPLTDKLGLSCITFGLKPLTRGINKAVKTLGVPKHQVALIGDQIFTDILGGNLAKVKTILVEPFEIEKKPTIRFKRLLEKKLFKRDFSYLNMNETSFKEN
jgi:HAD superfamily phosphatase (TIGR01668 family)